jgi:predicted house-cleaning noncanonical NTP pyrophosphatase (MazG superfamily)
MKYNKLVRDKIPEHIMQNGGKAITHIANEAEYRKKLAEKLQEEVLEFLESETPEELADILEVIEAICEYDKIDAVELQKIKSEKAERRGKFKDRIILEES